MYFNNSPRTYVLSKDEVKSGVIKCPKCSTPMTKIPFMKIDKLYRCDSCGFHIPKSKVLDCRDKLVKDILKIASILHFVKEDLTNDPKS